MVGDVALGTDIVEAIFFERSAGATVRRFRWVVAASLVVAEIQSGTSASFRNVAGSFVFPSMQYGSVTWPTDTADLLAKAG